VANSRPGGSLKRGELLFNSSRPFSTGISPTVVDLRARSLTLADLSIAAAYGARAPGRLPVACSANVSAEKGSQGFQTLDVWMKTRADGPWAVAAGKSWPESVRRGGQARSTFTSTYRLLASRRPRMMPRNGETITEVASPVGRRIVRSDHRVVLGVDFHPASRKSGA